MNDSHPTAVAYHLLVAADQAPIASRALRLLITDEAHEPQIRRLAREVLEGIQSALAAEDPHAVALSAAQMKIAHTAFKLALDDTQRDQSAERAVLRDLLGKLPDEHTIRAIQLQ